MITNMHSFNGTSHLSSRQNGESNIIIGPRSVTALKVTDDSEAKNMVPSDYIKHSFNVMGSPTNDHLNVCYSRHYMEEMLKGQFDVVADIKVIEGSSPNIQELGYERIDYNLNQEQNGIYAFICYRMGE